MAGLSRTGSIWALGAGKNPFASKQTPIKKELKTIIDEVANYIVLFITTIITDSCLVIIITKSDHR